MIGVGIWIYFIQPTEPPLWSGWASGGAALGLLGVRRGLGGAASPAVARVGTLAVALILLGFAVAAERTRYVAAPVWEGPAEATLTGRVRAVETIASAPAGTGESTRAYWRITLDRLRIEGRGPDRTPARIRLRAPAPRDAQGRIESAVAWMGRRVAFSANLSPPPGPAEPGAYDFRQRAWFQQLGATGVADEPPLRAPEAPLAQAAGAHRDGGSDPSTLSDWMRRFADRAFVMLGQTRAAIAEAARAAAPGPVGAVMAALLVGDRSGLDPVTTAALRDANLAHLLAISGLHMGIVCLTVFGAARFGLALTPLSAARTDPKKIAAVLALLAGAAYLALSGAAVSTQRAFIMAVVAFVAVLIDRPAITLRAVAIAATAILLWRPESLFDAGFQLSFAATTAMVAVFEALRLAEVSRPAWRDDERDGEDPSLGPARGAASGPWRRRCAALIAALRRPGLPQWAGALLVSAIVAGLATAPFAAFAFNRLTRYGLIANLAAAPAMGFWIMPSGVIALALAPFGLEEWGFGVMALGVRYVLAVAEGTAALPGAAYVVPSAPSSVLGLFSLGGLWLCLWRGLWLRLIGLAPLVVALTIWATWPRPDLLIAPQAALMGLATPAGRALDRGDASVFSARLWLRRDGDDAGLAEAAERPAFLRHRYGVTARSPSGWRVELVFGRRLDDWRLRRLCRGPTVLIAPRALAAPGEGTSDCLVLDRRRLGDNAVALWWPEPCDSATSSPRSATPLRCSTPIVRTTESASGRRYWTDAALRRTLLATPGADME